MRVEIFADYELFEGHDYENEEVIVEYEEWEGYSIEILKAHVGDVEIDTVHDEHLIELIPLYREIA